MGMFNDFLVNAKVIAHKAGEKACDMYDVTKLKTIKSRIASDIQKNFISIGKKYYNLSKDNSFSSEEVANEMSALDDLYVQYDSITSQIDDAKNQKRCPVCGAAQNKEKPFCADCGSKF